MSEYKFTNCCSAGVKILFTGASGFDIGNMVAEDVNWLYK